MASYRPAMKTADYAIYAALICVWTLPWAALSVAMFDPWRTSTLFSPFSGFWDLAFALYVIDCVATPYGCYVASTAPPVVSGEHKRAGLFTAAEVPGLRIPDGYKRSIDTWFAHPAR
jgi:hypothetical protein